MHRLRSVSPVSFNYPTHSWNQWDGATRGQTRPAFQGEPVVGKGRPYLSSLLCPDGAIPIGQYQPAAATLDAEAVKTVNQSMQQVRITFTYNTKAQ